MLMDIDKLYRKYVIYDTTARMFVGPSSDMWRVAMRNVAQRFTKDGAWKYIEHEKGNFVIEDAT